MIFKNRVSDEKLIGHDIGLQPKPFHDIFNKVNEKSLWILNDIMNEYHCEYQIISLIKWKIVTVNEKFVTIDISWSNMNLIHQTETHGMYFES